MSKDPFDDLSEEEKELIINKYTEEHWRGREIDEKWKRAGGAAFPNSSNRTPLNYFGMSLRDWFAGQALAGFLTSYANEKLLGSEVRDAYKIADAMLKEREK